MGNRYTTAIGGLRRTGAAGGLRLRLEWHVGCAGNGLGDGGRELGRLRGSRGVHTGDADVVELRCRLRGSHSVPLPAATGGANPATGYWSKELGGSSTFCAVGAAGGGWLAEDDPDDLVVSLCVFPDLSFIDDWGLAYHSDGSIRGTDLATAMQYQPGANLPPVYAVGATPPTC